MLTKLHTLYTALPLLKYSYRSRQTNTHPLYQSLSLSHTCTHTYTHTHTHTHTCTHTHTHKHTQGEAPLLIARSDANGEDLEDLAGAGLYDRCVCVCACLEGYSTFLSFLEGAFPCSQAPSLTALYLHHYKFLHTSLYHHARTLSSCTLSSCTPSSCTHPLSSCTLAASPSLPQRKPWWPTIINYKQYITTRVNHTFYTHTHTHTHSHTHTNTHMHTQRPLFSLGGNPGGLCKRAPHD